tara:strand:- start:4169 stop:4417 length:249 start_codon:yes stop_codon:yes gene_type:complete
MGFLKPKMPPQPDPLEVARANEKARKEADDTRLREEREARASESAEAQRRRANARAGRNKLRKTGALGVEDPFNFERKNLLG